MNQLKIILFFLLILLSLASCTVCSTCQCEKDGVSFTEKECATDIGLLILATGGSFNFDWEHLTPVYRGGIVDRIYDPKLYSAGFSPFVPTGNSSLNGVYAHELHHVWQSRSMGDAFAPNFILQALTGTLLGGGPVGPGNYYEAVDFYNWGF